MTHFYKDLDNTCACAIKMDAEWFMSHPSRSKFIREPWQCELSDDIDTSLLSQIVAVWIDQSIDKYPIAVGEIVPVRVYRRAFLFVGSADWHTIDSDEGVDRFMTFIDHGDAVVGARIN